MNGNYTKHIYIGSQRIVSKLGDLDSYGSDPRRIEYAGANVDGAKVDYATKYTALQQTIKDRYAKFEVEYLGKDNDDYVNGQGFCCDDSKTLKSFSLGQNDNPELFQYYYHSDHLGSSSLITNLDGEVVQHIEYVPFGEVFIEERNNTWNTPYLFNAKELDEETGLYYYGARYYDPRISLWLSTDPMQEKYPNISIYTYCALNPVKFIDPDGRYILFIGGLRLWKGNADQQKWIGGYKIHKTDVYKYWSIDKNSFGRSANIAAYYENKYEDHNVGYTSGSSHWDSQANQRMKEGIKKAELFHKMVQKGDITLKESETIKVISHSQGGAHAAGFVKKLMSYKDVDGNPLYKVEAIEYITPHQPTDFNHPKGPLGIQYSHPSDAVASDSPWWMPNGGTKYGKIQGIDKFYGGDIMGGPGQPPLEGATGNRNGHNVTDNDEFIKKGEK